MVETLRVTETIAAILERCVSRGVITPPYEKRIRVVCKLEPPATAAEVEAAPMHARTHSDLVDLWQTTRQAELFVDVVHGQWGLRLLSPDQSSALTAREMHERPEDMHVDDVVIGKFIGDDELLLLEGDGTVRVEWPIDGREDWPRPARSLREFLGRYAQGVGAKYWERQ